MSLRVVFDTSTLVSAALRADSVPDRALRFAIITQAVYASSESLIELGKALEHSKFDRYVSLDSRRLFLEKFKRDSIKCSISESHALEAIGVCRDANDDNFRALCLAANADVLVSSDLDLLVLHPWRGVAILTPAQFLEAVGG